MSELISTRDSSIIRWKLLTGVSALALAAHISNSTPANAEDANRPALWIELGGQFNFLNDSSETWVPANLPPVIDHPVAGILSQNPRIGYDLDGKLTFQPPNTDWAFSAAIRYGKAKRGPKAAHDQTYETQASQAKYRLTTYAFTNLHSVEETTHFILDFQAGKDVGLGFFGGHGSSTVNFGVRLAQFRESAKSQMTAQTNVPHSYDRGTLLDAYMDAARSFRGIGPLVTWNSSVPVVGSLEDGLTFDWGIDAAVLFGRQKAKVRTHTKNGYYDGSYTLTYPPSGGYVVHYNTAVRTQSTRPSMRTRSVIVPNVGAFAGISYRVGGRGKISLGYRADFFFGAMDGGIDTRKSEDIGFHGPFATISLGLGG